MKLCRDRVPSDATSAISSSPLLSYADNTLDVLDTLAGPTPNMFMFSAAQFAVPADLPEGLNYFFRVRDFTNPTVFGLSQPITVFL